MHKVCLALALIACGHPASPPPPQPPAPTHADDPSCPVLVPGTSVSVEDTPTGAAFVFVTTGDLAGVRRRAAALAAMHVKHDGPAMAMGMMIATKSSATESDIEHGARVTFTADDAAAIQSELRMHAQHLASGNCEMAM